MDSKKWRDKVYDTYISNGFQENYNFRKELEIQKRFFRRNYLKYMPLNKECRILELGCGRGQFYYFCEAYGYNNYIGIDVSDENIRFIKDHFGSEIQANKGDIFDFFNENEEKYDVVVFNDVIEHLTKEEIFTVLESIYLHMNEGGTLFIKTPNMANPFVSTAGRYIDITHETGFTECSMRQVLRACHFKSIRIVGVDIYVLNPLISIVAKLVSIIINLKLLLLSALYGRAYLRIFEKDILAVAMK